MRPLFGKCNSPGSVYYRIYGNISIGNLSSFHITIVNTQDTATMAAPL
jgi:hypothetical protein